jgi:hypothetical protein
VARTRIVGMPLSGTKRGLAVKLLRALSDQNPLNGVSGGRTYDAVIATCAEKGKASKSGICDLPFEIPSFAGTDFGVVISRSVQTR